jgi:hypothetical protein
MDDESIVDFDALGSEPDTDSDADPLDDEVSDVTGDDAMQRVIAQQNVRRRSGAVRFLDDDELACEERRVALTRRLIESYCAKLRQVIMALVSDPTDTTLKTKRDRLQAHIRFRCEEIGDDVDQVLSNHL